MSALALPMSWCTPYQHNPAEIVLQLLTNVPTKLNGLEMILSALADGAGQDYGGNRMHILAYHPCKADGPLTTYQQNVWFWSHKGEMYAKKQFLLDLKTRGRW